MRPHNPRSLCGELVDYRGSHRSQCINFKNGLIDSITEKPRGPHLDLTGTEKKIVPGLIDLHVHLRGLDLAYKEDEYTGSLQSLMSGITLIADMPNTRPYLNTHHALSRKLHLLKSNSWTDYTLYAGIPTRLEDIRKLKSMPIAGFKAYPADLQNIRLLEAITREGELLVIHPEYLTGLRMVEVEDNATRGVVRGCFLEELSVEYIYSEGIDGRIHVTHASCSSTIRLAKRYRYTVDITPHHLVYDNSRKGCLYRVNPPLRDPVEKSHLIRMVVEGEVDALASDHAPHAMTEKSEPLTCSPGFPWLPLWPWLLYARLVSPGALSLSEFLYYTSRRPAEILGLDGYGVIEHGARANIVVLDPKAHWRFTGFAESKHRLPVHFMENLVGLPEYVFVGGVLSWTLREGIVRRGHTINPHQYDLTGDVEG